MTKPKKLRSLRRALLIGLVLAGVAGGAAYALLQSQDVLTGNTISTASANLQISRDGVSYTSAQPGFSFSDVIPGGSAMPVAGYPFYLKNAGSTQLALRLAVTSAVTNPNNVDLSKVTIRLTTVGNGTGGQDFPLQSIIDAGSTGSPILGGNLAAAASQQYKLQVSMAADAVGGSAASIGNLDFAFIGVAQ